MTSFLQTKLEYLEGVGPQKAALFRKELQLNTFDDLLQYYPHRYEDRSQLYRISNIKAGMPTVYIRGKIIHWKVVQRGRERLLARLEDGSGAVTLVWLCHLSWALKLLELGKIYWVFGKPVFYGQRVSFIHPELVPYTPEQTPVYGLIPVYRTTKTLQEKGLGSRALASLQSKLLKRTSRNIPETLSVSLLQRYNLLGRAEALSNIHFPKSHSLLQRAQLRLKFEELFGIQLRLLKWRKARVQKPMGKAFRNTQLVRQFYHHLLPFSLTNAQKRVMKEIYQDFQSVHPMNRLVQGDVGSGKTIVAFLSMLICVGSGAQVAMMVPTEILAEQHYRVLETFAQQMGITIQLLTGTTKLKERRKILTDLQEGSLQIIVGTHALLNDGVCFCNLGLVIIDEQHRFGVAQRARLWAKGKTHFPHVLVMTATPIPRSLAMTLYGDLDVSVIDEMPPGRKPIKTVHYYDTHRLLMFQFLKKQLAAGKQAYIVYPVIKDSEKLTYKSLLDGYESVCKAFPQVPLSIVHGQMSATNKEYEMLRFVKRETKIMVATTVIEVGVNVPNASIIIIESAEIFGLAQLHQLRGRVGRGSEQAYCLLMTCNRLSAKSKERIQTMLRTNDGFEIAEIDLKLRGPGDLLGVQQSGLLALKIADLAQDQKILYAARAAAQYLLEKDDGNMSHLLQQRCKSRK